MTEVINSELSEGDIWMMGEAKELAKDMGVVWEKVVEVRFWRMEERGWEDWWKVEVKTMSGGKEWVARRVVKR